MGCEQGVRTAFVREFQLSGCGMVRGLYQLMVSRTMAAPVVVIPGVYDMGSLFDRGANISWLSGINQEPPQ